MSIYIYIHPTFYNLAPYNLIKNQTFYLTIQFFPKTRKRNSSIQFFPMKNNMILLFENHIFFPKTVEFVYILHLKHVPPPP